jgi:PAS domain S-box-containing protein
MTTDIPQASKLDMVSTQKVLLIEDNPGDAALVQIYLGDTEFQGCEVIHKESLEAGLAVAREEENLLAILLDLKLPDSSGLPTLEKIVDAAPNSNIIVLTGTSDRELGLTAVRLGAQDYLVKGSFDASVLSKTLRFSIERNRVLKRLEETQVLAKIGSWEYDLDHERLTASREFFRIFKLPFRNVVAIDELQSSAPFLFDFFQQIHGQTAVTGESITELDLELADGEKVHLYARCTASRSDDGGQVYLGMVQDVSERFKAQQEILRNQRRYKEIFSQSHDAIFIATFEGRLIDLNAATEKLLHSSREVLLSSAQPFHDCFNPAVSRQAFLEELRQKGAVKNFELRVENSLGQIRECLATASLLSIDEGEGYTCILHDVTEQRQVEKLRKAREMAEQSALMKEQFLASVSHEMRTPMNAILGMSNILLQMDLPEEQKDMVQSIRHSSGILLGIVNDILQISSLQNGKVEFNSEPFDLNVTLDGLQSVMYYKASEKDIVLSIHRDDSLAAKLIGDQLRLNQVLFNLVGNAVKFTDRGAVDIFVKQLRDDGNKVRLRFEVKDTGIGIPPDKIEAVFDTFTRIRTKDRIYEGTGLGLAICKSLVESQGGSIGAVSQPGAGSTFWFELDFEKDKSAGSPSEEAVQKTVEMLPEDATFSVLLVEDHKLNQVVARKTLLRKWPKVQITLAENGQEALDKIAEADFDIVLMDVQMPVMDGFEATVNIRKMPPPKSNIPILAMTAHAHVSRDNKFSEAGMNDFVIKPFDPENLFEKISTYVQITR